MMHNENATGISAVIFRSFFLGWIVLLISLTGQSFGATAAEVLKSYERLSGREREAKLVEGAKREAKLVYYGSTLADQMKRIFDEFNKRYPFITVGTYRSGAV